MERKKTGDLAQAQGLHSYAALFWWVERGWDSRGREWGN
jgi:hypothetical protein